MGERKKSFRSKTPAKSSNSKPSVKRFKKHKQVIGILITLIPIVMSGTILYWTMPMVNLEVGTFPTKIQYLLWQLTISMSGTIVHTNESGQTDRQTPNPTLTPLEQPTNALTFDTNLTFQVINSGKATAHDVSFTLIPNPSQELKILSGSVYAGLPLQSNFLGNIRNQYNVGLMGAGTSFSFFFNIQAIPNLLAVANGTFTFLVHSDEMSTKYTIFVQFNVQ
jgi:hypothetical protein